MPPAAVSYWLDGAPPARAPISGAHRADVVVVGAGFTGLWTSLALLDEDPSMRIVVLEGATVGHGASGRNGGFVEPSLTHGLANGRSHFPDELDELVRLGADNLRGLHDDVERYEIDCDLQAAGFLDVATEPWQLADLADAASLYRRVGQEVELLDAEDVRRALDSPTYLGGLHRPTAGALVDPGRLVRGLADAAQKRGARLYEHSPVRRLARDGSGVVAHTRNGSVTARRAVVATNAYSHRLVSRTGRYFVPVYDYVLVTQPLDAEQLSRIGWKRRQGVSDAGNQFHYYRLTRDDRILWGGYDAVYRFGNAVGPHLDHRRATYELLARHFRQTFPQLHDVGFAWSWGGPIATTTRFTVIFGEALRGRAVYALGYTGLGVAATRFAGRVLTERVLERSSPLLELDLTRTRPVPFPPEPLRWLGVQLTRRAIARADRRGGHRGPWLRALDRVGIGFDS
jgi:glycine/D-amino acid oxidase-like deaminating enzyme